MNQYVSKDKKYPEWAKMPEDYDFSSDNKDWSAYHKYFRLRTDAVWEKYKLRDYFRLYYKVFTFDPKKKEYYVIPPLDAIEYVHQKDTLKPVAEKWHGYSMTGVTGSFRTAIGPYERVKTSAQTNFLHEDYYDLCALRFQKWYDCDMIYYDEKYSYNKYPEFNEYPCYTQYYEAQYACSDDLFDFMLELYYSKKQNHITSDDYLNVEIKNGPTIYDNPDTNRKTYTY